jgi:hypothetical protein
MTETVPPSETLGLAELKMVDNVQNNTHIYINASSPETLNSRKFGVFEKRV